MKICSNCIYGEEYDYNYLCKIQNLHIDFMTDEDCVEFEEGVYGMEM